MQSNPLQSHVKVLVKSQEKSFDGSKITTTIEIGHDRPKAICHWIFCPTFPEKLFQDLKSHIWEKSFSGVIAGKALNQSYCSIIQSGINGIN